MATRGDRRFDGPPGAFSVSVRPPLTPPGSGFTPIDLRNTEMHGNLFQVEPSQWSANSTHPTVRYEMNTSEIAAQEFPVVRRGYDPSAVREFLTRLSETGVIAEIDITTLEQAAQADAARVLADAEAEAAALRAQAADEATALRAAAEADLAMAHAQARQILEDASVAATARLADADQRCSERAEAVIAETKQRLQRLLDAEAEVHVRLAAAFASIDAGPDHPIQREADDLLDLAFAEFFAADVEHDPSRAWILSGS